MTSSLALGAARCRVKCRQRHRRARNRASKNAICGADRVLLTGMQHCSGRYSRVRGRPSVVHEPYARRETTRARTERPRRHPGPSHRIGPESQKRNPGVNASEESNIGIVPAKPPNKVGRDTGGGGGGGKAGAKENIMMLNTCLTQIREISVSHGQCGVRRRRSTAPDVTTHRVDPR